MTEASTTPRASMNDLDPSDAAHRHTRSGVVLAVVSGVQFLAAVWQPPAPITSAP